MTPPRAPVVSGKAASVLAVLSGILYFLAFPGVDLWPLAFVALVPLIVALRGASPKAAFGLGWLSGFTMTMVGFYWLLPMLRTFSGFPTAICLLFMALLCAYQSGRIGVWGWLYARSQTRGWSSDVAFVLSFAVSEFLFPLLFPWYFGATVHDVPLFLQTADLGGAILVGVVLVLINLVIAEWVLSRIEKRPLRRSVLVIESGIIALALLYGAIRIPFFDQVIRSASHGTVGLVQANMSLMGKRKNLDEGLSRHLKLTEKLRKSASLDLVVWSETSVMRAVEESALEMQIPLEVGRYIGVPAIFGAVVVKPVEGAREYIAWNSALAVDEGGRLKGRYDKQFLVTFSEYIPFGDRFPILYEWSPNSGRFSPGERVAPLHVAGHDIMTIICYEDLSPSFVNRLFRNQSASLLVNMTNDAWFGDTLEPAQHLALAKLRAVEQRRYFVRATNSGVSAVVDPVGRTLAQTKTFTESTLLAPIAWLNGSTVFRVIGDVPYWFLTLVTFVMAFVRQSTVVSRFLGTGSEGPR